MEDNDVKNTQEDVEKLFQKTKELNGRLIEVEEEVEIFSKGSSPGSICRVFCDFSAFSPTKNASKTPLRRASFSLVNFPYYLLPPAMLKEAEDLNERLIGNKLTSIL